MPPPWQKDEPEVVDEDPATNPLIRLWLFLTYRCRNGIVDPYIFGACWTVIVTVLVLLLVTHRRKRHRSGIPTPLVCESKEHLQRALCGIVASSAKTAIETRGTFSLAVAGGDLLDYLKVLGTHKTELDWSKVTLLFANHECIEPTDSAATQAKALKAFASDVGITKVITPYRHPHNGSLGQKEASFYEKALVQSAGLTKNQDGMPVIDMVVLGLGPDGQVGSLRPGMFPSPTSNVVVPSTKIGEPSSITLSLEAMNAAQQVVVAVAGGAKGKKETVLRALASEEMPRGTFPAQGLKSPLFVLDTDAASLLQ